MATLQVEARPGAGVSGYSIYVDGVPVRMDEDHRGEVACAGRCGDGSGHSLLYSLSGSPGSSLAIVLRCSGLIVCDARAQIDGEAGAHSLAGRQVFSL